MRGGCERFRRAGGVTKQARVVCSLRDGAARVTCRGCSHGRGRRFALSPAGCACRLLRHPLYFLLAVPAGYGAAFANQYSPLFFSCAML